MTFIGENIEKHWHLSIFSETVPGELLRVTQELRANLSVFLVSGSVKDLANAVKEELLAQVEDFSGSFSRGLRTHSFLGPGADPTISEFTPKPAL
jgi:hypothetical protein